MNKEISFRIFVIHHSIVNDDYYDVSMLDKYMFVNVRNEEAIISNLYNKVNLVEFSRFIPLGKWYTESEVMYNLYKNQELYADVDYVGFIQYDMDASAIDEKKIWSLIQRGGKEVVFFQPFVFKQDYDQKVLMDPEQPDKLLGEGLNCYETIFKDFNEYYNEEHSIEDYYGETIGLCSAFLMQKDLYNQMMTFASYIIESGKLDIFDTKHRYRIQGGFLERYYATWMMLKGVKFSTLDLPHSFDESHAQMGSYERFRIYIFKHLSPLKRLISKLFLLMT